MSELRPRDYLYHTSYLHKRSTVTSRNLVLTISGFHIVARSKAVRTVFLISEVTRTAAVRSAWNPPISHPVAAADVAYRPVPLRINLSK